MSESPSSVPAIPTGTERLSRHYVKLCDLRDFDDEVLRSQLREMIAPRPPEEEVHRKYWEYAMLGLYVREAGLLDEGASVLSVAAGHEEPVFWFANHVDRVVATDIYGDGDFVGHEARQTMLSAPESFAPFPYRQDRLEVLHADALNLPFPDGSFDLVYSLSSIEHFGGRAEVRRAAGEMARVVRPGGHLVIVTECLVDRHPLDSPLVQTVIRAATLGRRCGRATPTRRITDTFTPAELDRVIVAPTGLALVQSLDTTVSPETRANIIHWDPDGSLRPATGAPFPHILLQGHGSPWTSAFLAFRKPG